MTNSRRRNYEVFALEDARPFMGNVTSDEGLRNDLKFFGRSFPLLLEDLLLEDLLRHQMKLTRSKISFNIVKIFAPSYKVHQTARIYQTVYEISGKNMNQKSDLTYSDFNL